MKSQLVISSLFASIGRHHPLCYYIFEGAYFLLQGASAKIQAVRIAQNLPISHFWWAAFMGLVAIAMVISYKRLTHCRWKDAIRLGASLLLIRFISFAPWLNHLRRKPMFYTGKGSVIDRLLSGWYVWAWGSSVGCLLLLQL